MQRGVHRSSWRINICKHTQGEESHTIHRGTTYAHAHAITHIHTRTHTRTHIHKHTCMHAHTHTHTSTLTYELTHSLMIPQLNLSSSLPRAEQLSIPQASPVALQGCCRRLCTRYVQGGESQLLIASLISDLLLALSSRKSLNST